MLKRLTIHLNLKTYTMLLALVSIGVIFTVITDGAFISSRNLSNLSRQTSVTAILSIGMVLIIVSGNIDLSVGFGSGLLGAIVAVIHVWFDQSVLVAMLIALLIGILIGILHGFLIAYQRVPAFIVTLGGFMVYRGLMLAITHDETIMLPNGWLKMLGNSYLPKSVGWILGSVNIHSSLVSSMVIGGKTI